MGIAFYLDRKLNLKKIFSVIGNNSNFIHIDIVDKSFSKNKLKNDISVLSEIKKIWPNHEIQTHIMSKRPAIILKEVLLIRLKMSTQKLESIINKYIQ